MTALLCAGRLVTGLHLARIFLGAACNRSVEPLETVVTKDDLEPMWFRAIPGGGQLAARFRCALLYLALIASLIGGTIQGDRGVFGSGPQLAAVTETLNAVMPAPTKMPLTEPQSEPRPTAWGRVPKATTELMPPAGVFSVVLSVAHGSLRLRHAMKPESQAPPATL